MELEKILSDRFSCRKFSDKKVPGDVLEKILEAGRIAPTAKNIQPFMIYVMESEEMLNGLDKITPCRFGAKTVLCFTYKKDEMWTNPFETGINSGVEDVSIVATHIMLEAKNLGVDSCWCNYFANTKLEELIRAGENEKSVLFMPIGYADIGAVPSPMHTKKKPLDQIVKFI